MAKTVTLRQMRLFLSSGSPLSPEQKGRFKRDLKAGKITVTKKKEGSSHGSAHKHQSGHATPTKMGRSSHNSSHKRKKKAPRTY